MTQNLPGEGQPAPSYSIDPNEYERLRQENYRLSQEQEQYQGFLEQLSPHAERVKRLLADDTAARIFDDSISAYESIQQRSKPSLPPEWDPERNPVVKRILDMDERISKFDQRTQAYDQQVQEQANQKIVAESIDFARRLASEYPVLAENNWRGFNAIVAYSQTRNVPLELAAEELKPMYAQTNPAVGAPTLRSGAGQIGVPTPTPRSEGDLKERFVQIMTQGTR